MHIHGPTRESVEAACEAVLRSLPQWFGIESALVDYVRDTSRYPTFVALDADRVIAFVTMRQHFERAWEVHCIAVRTEHRGHGTGRALIEYVERWARERGGRYLQVKTLDASAQSNEYDETRGFYRRMGFEPIEVFPTLWSPRNPCLQMLKVL